MKHLPVLLGPALDGLNIRAGGVYLDVTGGLGGHSAEILARLGSGGELVICDYHAPSVEWLRQRFAGVKNVRVLHERFSLFFDNQGLPFFDGILADFGISSFQLDEDKLGLSFSADDIFLDMRLDDRLETTAHDLLTQLPEKDLADMFYQLGGERHSFRIARALVHDRELGKLPRTTTELRGLCERVLGRFYRKQKIHPATKIFQALRLAVNHELDEIKKFLEKAPLQLKDNGRLVVIAFHEGEDRLVKTKFRELERTDDFTLPVRKTIKPDDDEIKQNPRSRSARMRILERSQK